MKPRLFSTMLLAFGLVIVLGICGMIGFFGLSVAGVWDSSRSTRIGWNDVQRTYVGFLADYYVARGNSWQGIDRRLDGLSGPSDVMRYTLVDENGLVVASSNPREPVGLVVPPTDLRRGTPIEVRGKRIGTVLFRPATGFVPPDQPLPPEPPQDFRRTPSFVWAIIRGFVGAGVGLGLVLLVLSAIFARWFSRPLRRMREAALALAGGNLDVRVASARVRELDDLALSFNTMATALSDADQQRRQLTADIAHELRTPLTVIKGRLEGLQDGVYQATPEQIERLINETTLLERLVEDLRVLALAEAGQLPLYSELTSARELLEDAAATFAAQAAAHGVALRVEADDTLPELEVDAQRLAQVLANLLTNALRYTPPGGTITLRAEMQQQASSRNKAALDNRALPASPCILFEVSDTGVGIPAADLPHIFNRFWKADRSRTRSSGSGLGLAIARQIVVAHGGQIWAESAEGCGTTICIALPVVVAPTPQLVA